MRKQKKNLEPIIQTLEALISDYDRDTLSRELSVIKDGLGWKVLRAALMKEYLNIVSYALDNAAVTGKQIEASYYSGVAQALYDTATSLIEKYKDVLQNKVGAVETVRPEE